MDLFLVYFMISYLIATTESLDTKNIWLHCAFTLSIRKTWFFPPSHLILFKPAVQAWEIAISEMEWLCPYTQFQVHFIFSFLYSCNSLIAVQIRASIYLDLDKCLSSNLNIQFAQQRIHTSHKTIQGSIYTLIYTWTSFFSITEWFESPR